MKPALGKYSFFLFLVPVFYLLHLLNEYFHLLHPEDLIAPEPFWWLLVSATAFVITSFKNLKYQRFAISLFYLSLCFFFYGVLQDWLRHHLPLLSRYLVLLPLLSAGLFAVNHFTRRTVHKAKLFLYLNSLFILLCLFEASVFLINQATNGQGLTAQKADFGEIKPISAATTNPDIYLLIFDGYSGNQALKKEWNFDNSAINSFLRARGFFVANHPKSNYNVTPYSIGSMLNMDYHPPFSFAKLETKDFMQGVATVSENRLCNFLTAKNYEVRNFSFFNMSYDQTRIAPFYVVNKRELIVNQTLLARFTKDRGWKNGNGALKQSVIDDEIKKENRIHYNRIGQTMSGLLNTSREKREKPVFVYAHFVLPHDPYFFDSTGRAYPEKEWTVSRSDKSRYLSQLVYTNSLIKNLADSLLKDAKKERIIVIASDHGYRSFEATADPQMQFENLMAVYYPTKRYPNFYDSISSVNTFRVILKDFFNMPLPLLKDSSVYIQVW